MYPLTCENNECSYCVAGNCCHALQIKYSNVHHISSRCVEYNPRQRSMPGGDVPVSPGVGETACRLSEEG